MPQVGVVLPTRDRPGQLVRAVDSVLAQSFRDLELVVVDDASTVPAERTLAKHRDARMRILRADAPLGPARARNLGLDSIGSPWVAFQDDDDEWLPGKLEAQIASVRAAPERVGLIHGRFSRVGPDGRVRPGARTVATPRGDVLSELLRGNFIALPAVLVRAAALEAVGRFDPGLPCFEDWELFIRLAERHEFDCVDAEVLRAHDSAAGVNRPPSATRARAFESILARHRTIIEREPRAHAWFLLRIGHHLCLAGRLREGRGYLARSLGTAPSLGGAASLAASGLGLAAYRGLARLHRGMR